MKTIIRMIVVCAVLIAGAGCTNDWLKPDQPSKLSPENAYNTALGMQGLINQLCKGLRLEVMGRQSHIRRAYEASDLAVAVNGPPRDYDGDVNPSSFSQAEEFWEYAYKQISYASVIYSRVDDMEGLPEDKERIKATGYFFLGYWYYRLMTTFGDVVLKLEEDTKPKLDYQTSTQQRILATMIPMLEYAVEYLPMTAANGQVNRAAGYMLLTKYYLMSCRFQDAYDAATEVIDYPGLALMKTRFGALVGTSNPKIPNPNVMTDLFYKYNASDAANTEKILVVQDYPGIDGGTSGGERMREHMTEWYNNHYDSDQGDSPTGTGSGGKSTIDGASGTWGPLGQTADIQILWTGRGIGAQKKTWYFHHDLWADAAFDNDMRHTAPNWYPMEFLVYNHPRTNVTGSLRKEFCSDTLRSWDCIYYNKTVVDDETRLSDNYSLQGGCMDWYIYRLAEAYLMRAETLVWLNRGGEATADINEIRRRAGAGEMAGVATLDDVLDERARELFLEEFRKQELTRIAYMMASLNCDGYSLSGIGTKNWYYDRLKKKDNIYFDLATGARRAARVRLQRQNLPDQPVPHLLADPRIGDQRQQAGPHQPELRLRGI